MFNYHILHIFSMKQLSLENLNRIGIEEFKEQKKQPIVIVLDNVRSAHNVGAAFRTSDAFSIEKVILCGITAQPPHREIQKTALGSTESVEWEYFETTNEAIDVLRSKGYSISAIEQTTESQKLNDFQPNKDEKYAFIFGNEAFGVDAEVLKNCDTALEIPQFGTKHSLNVSVSLGIILWHCTEKMNIFS